MKTLRNIFRRPLRSMLTISGIVIGVATLVVLGGMAEKINLLVDGGERYYGDKVIVTDASSASMLLPPTPIPASLERDIRRIDGVAYAFADAFLFLDEDVGATFGAPQQLYGIQPAMRRRQSFKVKIADGRHLHDGDRGKVVLGADLQPKFDAVVGDTITIRGRRFEVVGLLEKALNGADSGAYITFDDIQQIFRREMPIAVRRSLGEGQPAASEISVFPEKGQEIDELTRRIERTVPGVQARGPEVFTREVGNSTRIFNLIVICVAVISLVVGGLSIVNTMMMSVNERVREIGVRKAIGATGTDITMQFMREAVAISTIGGLVGLALGAVTVRLINRSTEDSALVLFTITDRLVAGSLVFAVLLGVIAGLIPAVRAARLDPVRALRHQ